MQVELQTTSLFIWHFLRREGKGWNQTYGFQPIERVQYDCLSGQIHAFTFIEDYVCHTLRIRRAYKFRGRPRGRSERIAGTSVGHKHTQSLPLSLSSLLGRNPEYGLIFFVLFHLLVFSSVNRYDTASRKECVHAQSVLPLQLFIVSVHALIRNNDSTTFEPWFGFLSPKLLDFSQQAEHSL